MEFIITRQKVKERRENREDFEEAGGLHSLHMQQLTFPFSKLTLNSINKNINECQGKNGSCQKVSSLTMVSLFFHVVNIDNLSDHISGLIYFDYIYKRRRASLRYFPALFEDAWIIPASLQSSQPGLILGSIQNS